MAVVVRARTGQQGVNFQVGAEEAPYALEGVARYPETGSPWMKLLRSIPLELEFAIGKRKPAIPAKKKQQQKRKGKGKVIELKKGGA